MGFHASNLRTRVICQAASPLVLRQQYPRIPEDKLAPVEIDHGYIRIEYYFEQYQLFRGWVRVPDPRPQLTYVG